MTSREEEFVHELQKSQWFDTTRIVSSQLSRLERLIEHAANQVPFYASRLTPVLNSSGNGSTSVDLSRWSAVPVLTRDEICANTADLIARSVPAESGSFVVRRSSGTTRRPLEFRRSQLSLTVSNCQLQRLYELYEFDFSKVFAHIIRDAAGNCNYPNGLESKGWNIANPDAPVMSLEIRTPPADQLEWLERVRPDYVMTYPNNLRAVAEVALARQSKLRFKVFVATGEVLDDVARTLIAKAFDCTFVDVYGAREIGPIAFQCPDGEGYHLCEETVFCELLDDEGAPAAPGQYGRMVVTPLYEFAMPFLRYDLGDYVKISEAPCSCGRGLRSLAEISGRSRNLLVMPDGSRIWPPLATISKSLVEQLSCRDIQFIQTEAGSIDIKYVPEKPDLRPDVRAVEKLLQSEFNTQFEVRLMPVDRIERGPGRKIEQFISLLPDSGAAAEIGKAVRPAPVQAAEPADKPYPALEAFLRDFASTLQMMEAGPRAQLAAWQADQLAQLTLFASVESPFYAERLAPLFRNGGTPDFNAWHEIPVLTRAELAAEIDRINPATTPPEVGPVSTRRTSGTTGDSLAFRTCALSLWAAEVMMHRLYRWHGFDLQAPMASIRFYGSGRRIYPDGITEARWSFPGPAAPHYTIDLKTPIEDLIEWLVRRRPTYLLTFPSIAHEIAEHPRAPLIKDLGLKAIVGISEIVAADARAAVWKNLGCPIVQIYACAEMGCIALQPPGGNDLLLCDETVLTEILDADGKPVEPGETGRVVITSLYNYATPLIRYEIGDYATRGASDLSAGIPLGRLQRVEGRRRNALATMHGKVWPGSSPFNELISKIPAKRFQLRQPTLDKIELVYVPEQGANEIDTEDMTNRLSGLIGRPITLVLSPAKQIQRTASGKYERIVSAVTC
jgi:phenylacetate-CoA ligase